MGLGWFRLVSAFGFRFLALASLASLALASLALLPATCYLPLDAMGDRRNSSSVDSTLGPKQNLFGRLQSATDGASTGSSASAAPPGKDVGIKRDTETQVSDKVKRMNSALHSPLKKMPQSEAEPTIADVMNVLLDQGRKMATKQDLREMQSEILRDTKIEIATAVDPLKEEVCELRDRVSKVESKARSPAAAGATYKQLMELQRLV